MDEIDNKLYENKYKYKDKIKNDDIYGDQVKSEADLDVDIENELQQHITEEFIEMVKKWVATDDKIRELNKEKRKITKERKEIQSGIIDYMETTSLDMFEITGGKLKKNVTKSRGSLSQKFIQNSLVKVFGGDMEKANKATKFIMDSRPITKKVNLKRSFNKKK